MAVPLDTPGKTDAEDAADAADTEEDEPGADGGEADGAAGSVIGPSLPRGAPDSRPVHPSPTSDPFSQTA